MAATQSLHLFLVARSIALSPPASSASTSAPWSNSNSVNSSLLSTAAACSALYNTVVISSTRSALTARISGVHSTTWSSSVLHAVHLLHGLVHSLECTLQRGRHQFYLSNGTEHLSALLHFDKQLACTSSIYDHERFIERIQQVYFYTIYTHIIGKNRYDHDN